MTLVAVVQWRRADKRWEGVGLTEEAAEERLRAEEEEEEEEESLHVGEESRRTRE